MTRILQLSDPHIMPEGALFKGRVDTAQALRAMLSRLAGLVPAIGPVERLVISGDLTEPGCAGAYAQFREIMAECPLHAQHKRQHGWSAMGSILTLCVPAG